MTIEKDKLKANNAQQLLDNPMFKEAFGVLEADLITKMKSTKFKEREERDEIWRKLQTLQHIETILRRYVTTGKMHEPKFIDKIANIGR